MNIFLVGEGRHDIGDLANGPPYRSGDPGFLQPIIEKIVGSGVRFDGQKVSLLGKKRVRGLSKALEEKAWRACLFAENAEADLLVFVTDLDKESKSGTGRKESARDFAVKREQIMRGFRAYAGSLRCVPGIPCRTIEAWAMGDRVALAEVSGAAEPIKLPNGRRSPEGLWGAPRDPQSNHPKMVLRRIFGRRVTQGDISSIGERADVSAVRKKCPLGFEPFVVELEEALAAGDVPT